MIISQIDDLSKTQVRYIFNMLQKSMLIGLTSEIKVRPSEVNYEYARKILKAIAESTSNQERQIQQFITDSVKNGDSTRVVAMDPVTGLVTITGMFIIENLISKAMKMKYKIEDENTLQVVINPSEELKNLIKELKKEIQTLQNKLNMVSANSNHEVDILILTAVEVEYNMVKMKLTSSVPVKDKKTGKMYDVGSFLDYKIAIRITNQGNPASASETEKAIEFFNPKIAFFVGIAGSRNPKKVVLGDVIAVDRVYSYEAGKVLEDVFASREKGGKFNQRLVELARYEARNKEWINQTLHKNNQYKVVVGAVASGDKVITFSKSDTAKLVGVTAEDSIAVEMEGLGFLTALEAHEDVKGIMIRSISDFMDKKDEDYHKGRALAAENATAFTFHLITKLDDEIKPRKIERESPRTIINNDNRVINTQNYIEKNDGTINISSKKKR